MSNHACPTPGCHGRAQGYIFCAPCRTKTGDRRRYSALDAFITEKRAEGAATERARIVAELHRLAAAADEVTDPQAAMLYEDFARWVESDHG